MARGKRRHFDRVSDYVGEQVAQLSRKYHRFRFIFLATFLMIGAVNLVVAGLALTVMVKVVNHNRFDDVGIVALSAASTSLVNLVLIMVNAVFRYSYKKEAYAEASKTIRNAHVAYQYKLGRYEDGDFDTFKKDVQNIVDTVSPKRGEWWQKIVRRAVNMEG